jgi:hypothetical protein
VIEAVRIGPGPFRTLQAEVLTDDRGRFELGGLAAGACEVRVRDAAGASRHVEVGQAAAEINIQLPGPAAGAEALPGTVRMMVLKHGIPFAGAAMLVVGAGDANTWKAAPRGLKVGNQTGHAGIVEWTSVESGRQYELTAWPYTARTVKVSVHGGANVRVTLEVAPEGTGAMKLKVPAGSTAWFVTVWGLPPGEILVSIFGDTKDGGRARGTITAGQTAELDWNAEPSARQDESPKEQPAEPAPPGRAPGETAPGDSEASNTQDAHDRPVAGVTLRFPAPNAGRPFR